MARCFFTFVTGSTESWSYEYRYYFDTDEKLIRYLERESEGGEEISGPNKQIKIDPKRDLFMIALKTV